MGIIFSISADTSNGAVEPTILYNEIIASGNTIPATGLVALQDINTLGDILDITHNPALDVADSGLLTQVVAAHTGVAFEDYFAPGPTGDTVAAAINEHAANPSAHHIRYADSEASGVAVQVAETGIQSSLLTHEAVADVHHSRYTDAEASGIAVQVAETGIETALVVHEAVPDVHHSRYTDAEASGVAVQVAETGIETTILIHESVPDVHHSRYTDTEASGVAVQVAETGIQTTIIVHEAVPDVHHSRYTDAEAIIAATGAVTLQTAYDAAPSEPQITLTTDTLSIRDNATPLSSAFRVQNSAGTVDLINIQGTVGGTQADIGSHDNIISGSNQPIMRVGDQQNGVRIWPTSRTFTSSPGSLFTGGIGVTYTHDYPNVSFGGLNLQFTMEHAQAGFAFNHFLLFNNGITFKNENGTAVNFGPGQTFISQPTVQGDGASVSMALYRDFLSQPTFNTINGGSLTVTQWGQVQCFGQINTGVTVGQRNAVHIAPLGGTGGTLTTERGIYLQNLDRGSTIYGVHSEMTGTSKIFIHHPGTSPCNFGGNVRINDGAALSLGTSTSNRVQLLRSAAGVMRMIGVGGTNNEGLEWDFDTPTANTIDVQSSTGAGLGFNLPAFVIGTSAADPTSNWQLSLSPGAKTTSLAGDFARTLFTASANVTINAVLSTFTSFTVNEPAGTIGTGSVTNAANLLIQTAPSVGTNRYGLLITSNPSGGTLNYAFRQSNASARARFDGRLDINRGIALGGGGTATLGTVGGSGPTTAAQAQWLEIDIGGTPHWIPVWT